MISRLSPVHREVLAAVLAFMRELVVHGRSNGLTSASLSGLMAPVLLRREAAVEARAEERLAASAVVEVLVDNYATIFLDDAPVRPRASPLHTLSRSLTFTLAEGRSCRRRCYRRHHRRHVV